MAHPDFVQSPFAKHQLKPEELVQTAFLDKKVPKNEAFISAKVLYSLSKTAQITELIGVFAHNAQHTFDVDQGTIDFEYPIPISNIDASILAGRSLLEINRTLPYKSEMFISIQPTRKLTIQGIVAANMFALETDELDEGKIAPYLREPFAEIDVLDTLSNEVNATTA